MTLHSCDFPRTYTLTRPTCCSNLIALALVAISKKFGCHLERTLRTDVLLHRTQSQQKLCCKTTDVCSHYTTFILLTRMLESCDYFVFYCIYVWPRSTETSQESELRLATYRRLYRVIWRLKCYQTVQCSLICSQYVNITDAVHNS